MSDKEKHRYSTMVEAINDLAEQGYTKNFGVDEDGLIYDDSNHRKKPEEITVDEFHRFEGQSNPSDMSIVYAIRTDDGLKGTVVDAFGTYGSEHIGKFMKEYKEKEEAS